MEFLSEDQPNLALQRCRSILRNQRMANVVDHLTNATQRAKERKFPQRKRRRRKGDHKSPWGAGFGGGCRGGRERSGNNLGSWTQLTTPPINSATNNTPTCTTAITRPPP